MCLLRLSVFSFVSSIAISQWGIIFCDGCFKSLPHFSYHFHDLSVVFFHCLSSSWILVRTVIFTWMLDISGYYTMRFWVLFQPSVFVCFLWLHFREKLVFSLLPSESKVLIFLLASINTRGEIAEQMWEFRLLWKVSLTPPWLGETGMSCHYSLPALKP